MEAGNDERHNVLRKTPYKLLRGSGAADCLTPLFEPTQLPNGLRHVCLAKIFTKEGKTFTKAPSLHLVLVAFLSMSLLLGCLRIFLPSEIMSRKFSICYTCFRELFRDGAKCACFPYCTFNSKQFQIRSISQFCYFHSLSLPFRI